MRFMDIRKRVSPFPAMGTRARFVAVPTTAGTGSEVTPFAVITDETTGVKYPLADYEIMPSMAIVDADLQMSAPPGLTAASGIDALSHALEAYASMMASGFTDALAVQALKDVFRFLPACYDAAVAGRAEPEARERMADAATMAGMAFANAFLGVMHAMAHKLGSFFHLPHGIANALMMEQTLRFNASSVPRKMGTFPQYGHPHARERYLELADALGIAGADADETFEAFVAAVRALQARVGIKPTIRDYVPDEADFLARLDEMVEQAFDDQCVGTNPRYPLLSEIRQMYLNAYYGKNDPV
jgi:acetaldehyde dehydrogenase/alcohol dehydrogenase